MEIIDQEKPQRLTRTIQDKMLGGVCGGLAKYFKLDPTLVRLGYVFLSIISAAFPGLLIYIIMWIIVPTEN
jgi:phage shock protein C